MDRRKPHFDVTWLFILFAVVFVVFPLLQRDKLDHCANDGSRWNTIFFLVEHGTYAFLPGWEMEGVTNPNVRVEDLPPGADAPPFDLGDGYRAHSLYTIGPFFTIDMIQVKGRYYSSKPPLLSTCLAGVVWCLERGLDAVTPHHEISFAKTPWLIMRLTVILVQVVPFILMIWLLRCQIVRMTDSAWGQNFSLGVAALATYLTPYLIPLNNHVIAAWMVMIALYAAMKILYQGQRQWYWFMLAGFFGAFAAGVDTPVAFFGILLFLVLLPKSPAKTLLLLVPVALIPAAAAMYTTRLVTDQYEKPIPMLKADESGPFYYPGSYWNDPRGIDAVDPPVHEFLLNILVGHHGFFLLTPIFLVSLLGIGRHLGGGRRGVMVGTTVLLLLLTAIVPLFAMGEVSLGFDPAAVEWIGWGWFAVIGLLWVMNIGMYARPPDQRQTWLAGASLLILAAILAVYHDKGYGGVCQGPRWLFWLIPLWLLMLPAGLELLASSRLGRLICYLLVLVSLVSVMWAMPWLSNLPGLKELPVMTDRPFNSSWAHEFMQNRGWIHY